ncbi:nucleotide pyrophosphohydrolase [Pseudoalteromonas sp. 31A1]|uniref:nucleotide pyrophosphohydrolase n=1 Tax=Pseudoalteromonas sp. 31A1 TaxID=2686351 RepID=UPI0013FD9D0A|nr:nucleotide pyrophosphohydrolase [Pseudoalteromonas sp. 31A1]
MKSNEIEKLINRLRNFSRERDWEQFHSPKNLVMALSSEAGELIEHFQWLSESESYLENNEETLTSVKEELADVFLYLIQISDKLGIDILECATKKIDLNAQKYPVSLSKGKATKYNKL